jgi:hypothetical protein
MILVCCDMWPPCFDVALISLVCALALMGSKIACSSRAFDVLFPAPPTHGSTSSLTCYHTMLTPLYTQIGALLLSCCGSDVTAPVSPPSLSLIPHALSTPQNTDRCLPAVPPRSGRRTRTSRRFLHRATPHCERWEQVVMPGERVCTLGLCGPVCSPSPVLCAFGPVRVGIRCARACTAYCERWGVRWQVIVVCRMALEPQRSTCTVPTRAFPRFAYANKGVRP